MWRFFSGPGVEKRSLAKRLFDAEGKAEVLRRTAGVLESQGTVWWLTYGALLGWVREGAFLDFDNDVDIAIEDGADPEAVALGLQAVGLQYIDVTQMNGRTVNQKFYLRGTMLDLYYVQRRGAYYYDTYRLGTRNTRSFAQGSHPVMALGVLDCDGTMVPVPEDCARYLEHLYGAGWRVADRDWDWRFSPTNATIYCHVLEWPSMVVRWLGWVAKKRKANGDASRRDTPGAG